MIPQVDLFSFVFLEKLKNPKSPFEINRPLGRNHSLKIELLLKSIMLHFENVQQNHKIIFIILKLFKQSNYGIYVVSIAASTQKSVDCSLRAIGSFDILEGLAPQASPLTTAQRLGINIIVIVIHKTKCSWQGLML